MPGTLLYEGTLVATNCWCGIRQAVPRELYDYAQTNPREVTIYCPVGHAWVFGGKSAAEKERERAELLAQELAAANTRALREREAREFAERQASAYKGQATKARKRAAAAACPCCNRTFVQLRRHLETKHPEYTGALAADPVTGGPP